MNDQLVLICGTSGSGKSASLRNLSPPEGVAYLNCEAGKRLPFPSKFRSMIVTDPAVVEKAILDIENNPNIHTLIVDSLTYLMDMFESEIVLTAKDTMAAWQQYQQYFKHMMQQVVAKSTKNIIFTAHVLSILNDTDKIMETKVPIKGALKNVGLESFFSTVIMTQKIDIYTLEKYKNKLLNITDEEKALGFKYVFQTKLTQDTIHTRIRSSMGMWSKAETYIDNDIALVMDRLHSYYK